jgi:anti-anti-sigma regulatory factor
VAQPAPPILTLRVDSSPTILRMAFRGELDLSCGELFDCLFDLEVSESQTVVLDLSELCFCDVEGVNALTGLRDYHLHLGRTVRLVHAAPHVARLIQLLEVRERLIGTRRTSRPDGWGEARQVT